jgi:preprotein translocase subunit SecD
MAILLRAGALPAPLNIVEERTVGAELGADSVSAGRYSALAGLLLVVLFMFLRYGMFGIFADIALTLNVVLLLAALTLFGATLTLPGIAGIVLTMGMAVDANVLIYERIREEQRNGRSMLASIDTGFRRAMATIVDANMTHLIASLILFQLGAGPVRGFAVTLGVGIITSFFTAVMVTRLIVIVWLDTMRPRRLTI